MIKFLALLCLAVAAALIYASKYLTRQRRLDADEIPMDMAKIERALTSISDRYRV